MSDERELRRALSLAVADVTELRGEPATVEGYLRPASEVQEPLTETVALEAGGTLSLLRFFDGTYRLAIETDGLNLGVPLTARDMRGLREATGAMVLGSLLDVAP